MGESKGEDSSSAKHWRKERPAAPADTAGAEMIPPVRKTGAFFKNEEFGLRSMTDSPVCFYEVAHVSREENRRR